MKHHHAPFNMRTICTGLSLWELLILKNLLNCIFVILILFGYLVTHITQYQTTMYICSLTAITTAAYLAKKHNAPFTGFPGNLNFPIAQSIHQSFPFSISFCGINSPFHLSNNPHEYKENSSSGRRIVNSSSALSSLFNAGLNLFM